MGSKSNKEICGKGRTERLGKKKGGEGRVFSISATYRKKASSSSSPLPNKRGLDSPSKRSLVLENQRENDGHWEFFSPVIIF